LTESAGTVDVVGTFSANTLTLTGGTYEVDAGSTDRAVQRVVDCLRRALPRKIDPGRRRSPPHPLVGPG
jgi:hypothetical protein